MIDDAELWTRARAAAADRHTITALGVPSPVLMERAALACAEVIQRARAGRPVHVLCGPGNNGGDGFVVARLLKEWGWEVEVFLYGDPERMPPDARVNYERWRGMGEVRPLARGMESSADDRVKLIVDAIFGTGLTRPIQNIGLTLLELQEARAVGSMRGSAGRTSSAAVARSMSRCSRTAPSGTVASCSASSSARGTVRRLRGRPRWRPCSARAAFSSNTPPT